MNSYLTGSTSMLKICVPKAIMIASLALHLISSVSGLELSVPSTESKCFGEEWPGSVSIKLSVKVLNGNGSMQVDLKIEQGIIFRFFRQDINVDSFTVQTWPHTEVLPYKICLIGKALRPGEPNVNRIVIINFKVVRSEEMEQEILKANQISDVQGSMLRIEYELKDIVQELQNMHANEKLLRKANENTNTRVTVYSILSCSVMVLASLYQHASIRRFFKRIKLIDLLSG